MHGRHVAVTERCECRSGREYFGVVNPEITRINRVDIARRRPSVQAAGPLEPKIVIAEIDKGAVGQRRDGRAPAGRASLRPQQLIQFGGPANVDVDVHR